MDLYISLMGFIVGIFIGLTSMGGAALMAPFLILFVGVPPVIAVGTDLAFGGITKIVGAGMHWRQGNVDLTIVRKLAIGSVPGGIMGVLSILLLNRFAVNTDQYIRQAIGVVLLIVALVLILRSFEGTYFKIPKGLLGRLQGYGTVIWGGAVGFTVGITSVGSGSLIIPFLLLAYPLSPITAVGTDVFHSSILVSVTAIAHFSIGNVDWGLVSGLLIGSLPGVVAGSYLATCLPAHALRIALAIVLLLSGVRMV